ncbi:hypothetical protein PILCRDRAFT_811612 [Piloderma croceum F 1598]|uniref:Uncharacterized protein n=1 Tax=Piloderma croceum (strain F 1598) TaxID=765440 RepID=A0A0C3CN63_PILCF|nr:hypothetical protein PILCRDRAFT_811612 [Piloderma croceum F 1598]
MKSGYPSIFVTLQFPLSSLDWPLRVYSHSHADLKDNGFNREVHLTCCFEGAYISLGEQADECCTIFNLSDFITSADLATMTEFSCPLIS